MALTIEEQKIIDSMEDRIKTLETKQVSLPYPLSFNDKEILLRWLKDGGLSSVLFDVNWDDYLYYHTFFEGADVGMQSNTGTGGNVGPGGVGTFGALTLSSGTTLNNEVTTQLSRVTENLLDYNNKQRFKTNFYLQTVDNVEAYLANNISSANNDAYGFHIVNSELRGFVDIRTTKTEVVLATLTGGVVYEVEARLNPLDKVVFYVDDVELGTISSVLPNGDNDGLIYMSVKTTNTVNKDLTIERWELIAQRT